ncbi:MAG: hypothetical protein ACI4QJ_04505 [Candidatus Spyradenecus sp.]
MRKVLQCCFSWLLLGVAGLSVAEPVRPIEDLTRGDDGTYTLETDYVYLISAAGETGVTKEYTLTTPQDTIINAALQINLGTGSNTVILNLNAYTSQTEGLEDAEGYAPALKVIGNGRLIIRHKNTAKIVCLRIKDLLGGERPVIDLSGMAGGEVRFERASGESGSMPIELRRVWAIFSAATSSGNVSKPVIVGKTKVRLIFANNACVRFQASPCVVKDNALYVLPELISVGYAAMRIEEGAVVRVRRYGASTNAVAAKYSWEAKPLFPNVITLAGGSLELDEETGTALVEIPSTSISAAIALVRGQGEAFGKKIFTVSTQYRVVPESCIKVADGSMLTEEERKPDENGRLVIAAAKSPELVYAQTSESDQNAVMVFGLTPEITETGCTIKCNFGIAELKVDQVDSADFVSTLTISVDLPTETASTRSLYLRILQTAPNGTVSTIYPASGTAALTTFTRDATDSIRFSASVPCRITPSLGTTAITIRAYATPPAE